jgi:hypothetical protein
MSTKPDDLSRTEKATVLFYVALLVLTSAFLAAAFVAGPVL